MSTLIPATTLARARAETIEYAAQVIDVVVRLDRAGGRRGIVAIAQSKDLLAS